MLFYNFLTRLSNISLDDSEESDFIHRTAPATTPVVPDEPESPENVTPALKLQREIAFIYQPYFNPDGLVEKSLEFASNLEHIMDFTQMRALSSLFSMLNESVRQVHSYNASHTDFPLEPDVVDRYISKSLINAILWSFTGDAKLKMRYELGEYIRGITTIPLPPASANIPIVDYEVCSYCNEYCWKGHLA